MAPRFSKPVRALGWLSLALLALLFIASVGHWWLSRQAHALAERARAAVPKRPAPVTKSGGATEAAAKPATPVAQVPLIGALYSGDAAKLAEYEAKEQELRRFTASLDKARVSDRLSFLAVLKALGETVPEGMTEAEAAAIFLTKAKAFEPLLAEWKAAMAAQPWDFSGVDFLRDKLPVSLPLTLGKLLGALTEAAWLTGDAAGAQGHWEMLTATVHQSSQPGSLLTFLVQSSLLNLSLDTFQAGVSMGAWTNEQLAALPGTFAAFDRFSQLASSMEGEKRVMEAAIDYVRADPVGAIYTPGPDSPWWQSAWVELTAKLTTEQRLRDNLDVMHAEIDGMTARYDAANNRYWRDSGGGPVAAAKTGSWFERFYYVYADMAIPSLSTVENRIAEHQVRLNLATIAAQLELQKRTTGSYPAALPPDAPHNPTSGEPYAYQLTDDGQFKLWGNWKGGSPQDGTVAKDIVWPQRRK